MEIKQTDCANSSDFITALRKNYYLLTLSELIQYERQMNLEESLSSFKNTAELADMTIICGNDLYMTHRVMLAAGSRYFQNLFRVKPKLSRITIKELGPRVLEMFLDFIYTGNLKTTTMTEAELGEALVCLKTLELIHMKSIGEQLLGLHLSPQNFFKIWELLHLLNFGELEITVIRYVFKNLELCLQEPEYCRLSLSQMTTILSCSSQEVQHSPKLLYRAIIYWYRYNEEVRKKYLPSLFTMAGLMLPEELKAHLSQKGVRRRWSLQTLMKSQSVKPSIPTSSSFEKVKSNLNKSSDESVPKNPDQDALPLTGHFNKEVNKTSALPRKKFQSSTSIPDFRGFADRQHPKPPPRPTAPPFTKERFAFPSTSEDILCHSTISNDNLTEKTSGDPPANRYLTSMEYTRRPIGDHVSQKSSKSDIMIPLFRQGSILIICLESDRKAVLCSFDVIEEQWTKHQLAYLPLAENSSMLLYNNFLYILGGERRHEKLNTLFSYDLRTGLNTRGPNLLMARSTAGFVVLHGQMYAIGGIGRQSRALTQTEMLPSERSSWQPKAPLHVARRQPSVTTAFGKIYAIGGYPEVSQHAYRSCECYSVAMDQWTEISSLPEGFADSNPVISVRRDSIYALRSETPTQLFRYSAIENEWSERGSLSIRIAGKLQSAVFIRSNLWIFQRDGKAYEFNIERDAWRSVVNLPSSIGTVLQAFLIEESIYQDDL